MFETKRKKGGKKSPALPRMWPRHTTITQTIWWNICFPFHSWSCISCERCGWWEVWPACVRAYVCVCRCERCSSPIQGPDSVMYIWMQMYYFTLWCALLYKKAELRDCAGWKVNVHHAETFGPPLEPSPPLGLKKRSMLNSYNLICSEVHYRPAGYGLIHTCT